MSHNFLPSLWKTSQHWGLFWEPLVPDLRLKLMSQTCRDPNTGRLGPAPSSSFPPPSSSSASSQVSHTQRKQNKRFQRHHLQVKSSYLSPRHMTRMHFCRVWFHLCACLCVEIVLPVTMWGVCFLVEEIVIIDIYYYCNMYSSLKYYCCWTGGLVF